MVIIVKIELSNMETGANYMVNHLENQILIYVLFFDFFFNGSISINDNHVRYY